MTASVVGEGHSTAAKEVVVERLIEVTGVAGAHLIGVMEAEEERSIEVMGEAAGHWTEVMVEEVVVNCLALEGAG